MSKKVSKASAGKNPFDVNMCAIIARRENGKGYAGLESVFGYINLVPVMNVNSFNKSMGDIISSYKQCAEDSMNSAAENVRQMNNEITVDNEKIVDIVVSSDGAYVQRNVLEMAIASAVINFNDGNCGVLNVFINTGMQRKMNHEYKEWIKRQINKRNSNEKRLRAIRKKIC